MTGIYLITCKITAVGYVGLSINIKKRWRQHKKRFNPELFNYEVLEECSKELLGEREKHWIVECGTLAPLGFNETTGGQGGSGVHGGKARKGKTLSEEHKRKIGLAHKGKVVSEEARKNISKGATGRIVSDATKQKLREKTLAQWEVYHR